MADAKRYDVIHADGRTVEVVRDLDLYTARRLAEADVNGGRSAVVVEHVRPERRTYR